jgi:peptidoglycan/xylan/chitin deacetylase (PgdA/CDA1 family)
VALAVAPEQHLATAPFTASRPLLLFDHHRIPYRVDSAHAHKHRMGAYVHEVRGERAALYWPQGDGGVGRASLDGIPLVAAVRPDAETAAARDALGSGWTAALPVHDERGERIASVWRSGDGDIFLPFDPDDAIRACWSEAYLATSSPARGTRAARGAYYALRPLLPRAAQIRMRRAYSRVQARSEFPRWPVEPALHDLIDLLLGFAGEIAGGAFPAIAPWPGGRSWGLVLTHDVETALGRDSVHVLRDVEAELGYRSSWNFVPRRYADRPELREELLAGGFEVGLHGLHHDGRDISRRTFDARLPEMREYAERWQVTGFRSPATHRDWDLMPRLGVDYDTSYTDTAPFEPQSGGCCTWLPYFNRTLVELPITLLQDHTLFEILEHDDEQVWVEKADLLRRRGGMALVLTHPDYMLAPARVAAYRRFLERYADDATAWRALPRDVSAWWRRRAASHVARVDGEWRVLGPAAGEATVELHGDVAG